MLHHPHFLLLTFKDVNLNGYTSPVSLTTDCTKVDVGQGKTACQTRNERMWCTSNPTAKPTGATTMTNTIETPTTTPPPLRQPLPLPEPGQHRPVQPQQGTAAALTSSVPIPTRHGQKHRYISSLSNTPKRSVDQSPSSPEQLPTPRAVPALLVVIHQQQWQDKRQGQGRIQANERKD